MGAPFVVHLTAKSIRRVRQLRFCDDSIMLLEFAPDTIEVSRTVRWELPHDFVNAARPFGAPSPGGYRHCLPGLELITFCHFSCPFRARGT